MKNSISNLSDNEFTSVSKTLTEFGEKLVDDLGKSLDPKKNASGKLRESIHFTMKVFTERYEFKLMLEDYYKWVDEGRKKGKMPPVNAIMKWIGYKRLGAKIQSNKKLTSSPFNPKNRMKQAFAIAKGIAKNGIKPTNFYTDVVEDGRIKELKDKLSKALKQDVVFKIKQLQNGTN